MPSFVVLIKIHKKIYEIRHFQTSEIKKDEKLLRLPNRKNRVLGNVLMSLESSFYWWKIIFLDFSKFQKLTQIFDILREQIKTWYALRFLKELYEPQNAKDLDPNMDLKKLRATGVEQRAMYPPS
jgi:hypothetical protein